MSFGDHLEELRSRLVRALIALAVSILALMPFKDSVTDIYVAPYHTMWLQGFRDHLAHARERYAALGEELKQATSEGERHRIELALALWRPKVEWLDLYAASILAGDYPFQDQGEEIRSLGGYQVSYYLVATRPIEDFWTFMAASALFSVIVAGPYMLYQAWAFIAAGLYQRERRVVLKYVPGAATLLVLGVLFGYFVCVPYGMYFLVKLMNFGQVQPMITVSQYFDMMFMLTASLGLVFQMPLVMLALQKVGLVSHRTFAKQWRYVILGIFIIAAVVTPSPDPFTQTMLAVPMTLLYLLGLFLTSRSAKQMQQVAPEAVEGA